ncbi:MAG: hypothetical protein II859_13135 [Bacteroidales bacterium]|nr:hypothetical protein [Bacteroidales bacterium]
MNFYIVVEGDKTEMSVYPAWLSILAPNYTCIEDASKVGENNYYLFSGGGMPSIFKHVKNAVLDINAINSQGGPRYDYLLVCLDTEEESREYIMNCINDELQSSGTTLQDAELVVFEQKICMETWFLGNQHVFKDNPQNPEYLDFIHYYNVGRDNPEEMGNINENRFTTTAKFHLRYLKRMLEERNMTYSKNNTETIRQQSYLQQLIRRYEETGHLSTFGSWYEFVKAHFK